MIKSRFLVLIALLQIFCSSVAFAQKVIVYSNGTAQEFLTADSVTFHKLTPEEKAFVEESKIVHQTEPRFSEMVEMMGLLWYMVGSQDFSYCNVSDVTESAKAYFASMKNHQAVSLAREYSQQYLVYDAVSSFGNHLLLKPNGEIIFDPDYQEGSDTSFDRWSQLQKSNMLAAVNDFYKQSKFHEWFLSTENLQKQAINSFKRACTLDYDWFEYYYGKNDKIKTRIILSFFIGPNNQGISFTRKDGTIFLTPTFGCLNKYGSKPVEFGGDMNLVVHEFNHPYCNPLIRNHWSEISAKAQKIFKVVSWEMERQAYSDVLTMMCETLVRACAIRYMMSHNMEDYVDYRLNYEENNGFVLVRSIVELLDKREKQASDYNTLEEFMPEIINLINNFDESKFMPVGKHDDYTNDASRILLPGKFSVGLNKKVQFTRGNLYWNGSELKMEQNQVDHPIEWNENYIGHFMWAKTLSDALKTYYNSWNSDLLDDHMFCDGSDTEHFLTIEGTSGLRVLSSNADSELLYLLYYRPNAGRLMKKFVTLEGVGLCIVLAPDDYTGTIASKYDAASWKQAENEGLVCFAPTGLRWDDSLSSFNGGYFWMASHHDSSPNHAYGLEFDSEYVYHYGSYGSRNGGKALRLVKDVTE